MKGIYCCVVGNVSMTAMYKFLALLYKSKSGALCKERLQSTVYWGMDVEHFPNQSTYSIEKAYLRHME